MMHIIVGLFFIALGIWGVFDEWYYVVDFLKGSSSVLLTLVGFIGILAGVVGPINTPAFATATDMPDSARELDEDD